MIRFDERKTPDHLRELTYEKTPFPKRIAFVLWTMSGIRIGGDTIRLIGFHCSNCDVPFTVDRMPVACPACGCGFHEYRDPDCPNAEVRA